jgi:hypothetical protein
MMRVDFVESMFDGRNQEIPTFELDWIWKTLLKTWNIILVSRFGPKEAARGRRQVRVEIDPLLILNNPLG